MKTIMIVDDEKPARAELRYLIGKVAEPVRVIEAGSGSEAVDLLEKHTIDIAFLDINMQDMDGITLSKEIRRKCPGIPIVFATAYDAYAVKAFELDAVDYVLKPFEESRIAMTMGRLLKEDGPVAIQSPQGTCQVKKLSVWRDDRILLIDHSDIICLMADDRNTLIKAVSGEYVTKETLCSLEKKLDKDAFLRVHRAYLINSSQVKEILPWFNSTYMVRMHHLGDLEIPVSRSYIKGFKEVYGL